MTTIHKHMRAEASLNASAEPISKGNKKSRLQLGKTSSTGVFIAAHHINNPFKRLFAAVAVKSKRFAKFKTDNQTFLINVKSASKRLHCSKEQIQDSSKPDYFSWLVNQAETTELILNSYTKIYNKHFSEQIARGESPLFHKNEETKLTACELMNVVRGVSNAKVCTHLNLTKNKRVVVMPSANGKISLKFMKNSLSSNEKNEVIQLSKKFICKISKKTNEEDEIKKNLYLITNELKIVQALNKNGPQDGILLNIDFIEPYGPDGQEAGLRIPYYEKGDYSDVCKRPLPSYDVIHLLKPIKEFEKLLHGLSHIHKTNIIHGDLKPENIFLNKNRIDIADYGSSIKFDEPFYNTDMLSPNYRSVIDDKELDELAETSECFTLLKAIDIFGLGSIFCLRLTQTLPYELVNYETNVWQSGLQSKQNPLPDSLPQELQKLICNMTKSNWRERPTAEKLYGRIKKYRQLLEEIFA